ncbi:DUF1348 family protein [Rhodanobacter soli]
MPPFTEDTATQKVRLAEEAWNSRGLLPSRGVAAWPALFGYG